MTDPLQDPGVAGLAQLGRNAIERVSELEARIAMIARAIGVDERVQIGDLLSRLHALLAANRDLQSHFDALKGDYDEAAHFARHFVRDDPHITPRGAIIRLGDKCTDLFCRLQSAEQERDRTESQRQFACAEVARIATERDAANAYVSELNDSLIAVHAEAVALEAERDALKLRAEQAEARLAEIEAAPTVQTVFVSPFRQIELIARPEKDQSWPTSTKSARRSIKPTC
jgi:DNA repair exonuclease SbcCD ATPase subunit